MHDQEMVTRPFVLTQGRTRPCVVRVAMESIVERRTIKRYRLEGLDRSQMRVIELLVRRQSCAELSARSGWPLGIVMVLVSDLAEAGYVVIHDTVTDPDLALMTRLVDGLRTL